ncbi:hypothetical protein GCM10009416_46630 [Craurococcus roseus]|uniref:Uncharacterized protein n=1 Tax=Craurococcus roseus TaxID=77585 RepID=A0ABN1G3Z7_9PROT
MAQLLLVLALPGCETMERMDYLDRFFEQPAWQRPAVAGDQRPGPAPTTGGAAQAGSVVAMEPRPNPPSAYTAVADLGVQPGPVVAMEPRPNPPSSSAAAAADVSAQPNRPRAAEPRPETFAGAGSSAAPQATTDPEARTRLLVRQNPWLTRFWMELTPAQQSRVERQLRRGDVVLAVEGAEPAVAWDSMGLADRAALIFGRGQPPERPAPPERRDGSTWARNS